MPNLATDFYCFILWHGVDGLDVVVCKHDTFGCFAFTDRGEELFGGFNVVAFHFPVNDLYIVFESL